jgi:hypothetical protein
MLVDVAPLTDSEKSKTVAVELVVDVTFCPVTIRVIGAVCVAPPPVAEIVSA